jgi:hypothetical protein
MSRITLINCIALWLCATSLTSTAATLNCPYSDTFSYVDIFNPKGNADANSYAHSLFWSKDVNPLPQPYLYYLDSGGLVFVDYQGKLAELCYAFAVSPGVTQKLVTGIIQVVVSLPNMYISPSFPSKLFYQTSPNGIIWSGSVALSVGSNRVQVSCPEGTCYLRFSGTRVAINSLSVSLSSKRADILVAPTGDGANVLQQAIDLALNGWVIEAAAGKYSGIIDFKGKSITLRSATGPANTTINCVGTDRGVYMHGGDANLVGFTIKGARVSSGLPGGGIYVESGSPTIANCIITDCTAGIGGGIGISQAQPTVIGCSINNCTAVRGGGIGLLPQSNAKIIDCTIEYNQGTGAGLGGGVYCQDGAATFNGCRVASNTTGIATGGGIYCTGGLTKATLQNCLIVGNSATLSSGVYAELSSSVNITNCTITRNGATGKCLWSNGAMVSINSSIIWDNGSTPVSGSVGPVSYSDIEGGYAGSVNVNPSFVSPLTGDFHLLQTSPCIDAGDPTVSATTEPVPSGDRIDMGRYGGSPEASKGASHTIYHVACNRNSYSGPSSLSPFATIQPAIDKAQSGDTILIWPGVYLQTTDPITLRGKAIRIQSAADAAAISAPYGWAFSFDHGETSSSVLSNLIVEGCLYGGIWCYGSSPTLKNLTIVGNTCGVDAEANANPTIVNCLFWANGNGADLSQDSGGICNPSYSLWKKANSSTFLNGSVIQDPCFADALNGDYHLKSKVGRYVPSLGWVPDAVNSPCIDQGDLFEDPRGETMPNGGRIDIGAHGGTPYASLSNVVSH